MAARRQSLGANEDDGTLAPLRVMLQAYITQQHLTDARLTELIRGQDPLSWPKKAQSVTSFLGGGRIKVVNGQKIAAFLDALRRCRLHS